MEFKSNLIEQGLVRLLPPLGKLSNDDNSANIELLETAFLLKHVEEHGREDQVDPWSIRQLGVYTSVDSDGSACVVVINPSITFQQRLKSLRNQRPEAVGFKDVISLLLSSASSQWRSYLHELELGFEELVSQSSCDFPSANVKKKQKANDAAVSSDEVRDTTMTIEFDDTQRMRVIGDKALRVEHILGNNIAVFKILATLLVSDHKTSTDQGPTLTSGFSALTFCQTESDLQLRRIASLLKRMNASSELVSDLI